MNAEPQKEHRWLQQLVGDWTYEIEGACGPDKPPQRLQGTERVRAVGGLWVLCEGRGEMPESGTASTLMTLGYDPQKGRFVGTWVGSMMTWLWVYDGALDPAEKILTLHSEGPDFAVQGKLAKYKDEIEFRSDDHRVLTTSVQGDDGRWRHFMTANYRRQ